MYGVNPAKTFSHQRSLLNPKVSLNPYPITHTMDPTQNPNPVYDIVILGASGFTGKYVVREALKFLQTPSSPLKSLALAGRNPTRLTQSLEWASRPNPPPSSVDILTADTSDPDSLRRLCTQTKLILNCVGPFRIHGDPVVAACADSG